MTGRVTHFLRSSATGIMVVLTAVSFLAAAMGFWLNRNTLNTDVWVDRVGPLASDPAVESALTDYTTAQIMSLIDLDAFFEEVLPERGQILAGPLTGAIEDFVRGHVGDFSASDEFDELWVRLNERVHAAAVDLLRGEGTENVQTTDGEVVLDLVPVINRVLARIGEQSPDLLGREVDLPTVTVDDVPAEARERLEQALGRDLDEDFATVTVFDSDKLETVQSAVRLFDGAIVVMAILTTVLAAITLLVARDRRRAGLYLLVAFAADLVLVRRLAFTVQGEVGNLVKNPANEGAAEAVTDAFIDPLSSGALVLLWIIAALALALILAGPSKPAVAVRRRTVALARAAVSGAGGGGREERATAWVTDHRTALQVGAVVAAVLLLLWLELSWVGLLILIVVVALWELAVSRIAGPSAPAEDTPAAR